MLQNDIFLPKPPFLGGLETLFSRLSLFRAFLSDFYENLGMRAVLI